MILQNYENKNFAATLCRSRVRGGGPVQPWRILRANADCTVFLFPLYVFHSVIYNSVDHREIRLRVTKPSRLF